MPQIIFQQGEDIIVELPIEEAGSAVDISTATNIRVQAYVTKNNVKTKEYSYSKTPKSGYGVCRQKTGSGNEHKVEVLLTRAQTVTFDIGVLSFSAIITMPGATDFPQGINSEYNFDSYGTVQNGSAKDEVIP
jgi:hypothetical protein